MQETEDLNRRLKTKFGTSSGENKLDRILLVKGVRGGWQEDP